MFTTGNNHSTRAGALWCSHHLVWMGASDGWVPVKTHSTPVPSSEGRLWVARHSNTAPHKMSPNSYRQSSCTSVRIIMEIVTLVDTHSTPVQTSVRRLWVVPTTSTSRALMINRTGVPQHLKKLNGQLIRPSEGKWWPSENCMKFNWGWGWGKKTWKEIQTLFPRRSSKNSIDFNYFQDGQIRLREIMQGISKKLMDWAEFDGKKLIGIDKREVMNYLCNKSRIPSRICQ